MLVLSRKVGERIHIGNNVTVEVRRISGSRVTLALDAPRGVRILRGELHQAAHEFDAPEPAKQDDGRFLVSHGPLGSEDLVPQPADLDFAI